MTEEVQQTILKASTDLSVLCIKLLVRSKMNDKTNNKTLELISILLTVIVSELGIEENEAKMLVIKTISKYMGSKIDIDELMKTGITAA